MPPDSKETARRFVLGRQGLWPGRRWKGRRDLAEALQFVGSVQVDPLNVVGKSQDLALWGRIIGYQAQHLEDALYKSRIFFESGGNVQIRPISELPYFRVAMERKVREERWRRFARTRSGLIANVAREIDRRGPLGPKDFEGPGEKRIQNYRAATESGLALYYLWLKGDVMIAFRRRGEKVFDLTDRLFGRSSAEVPVADAERHLILDSLRQSGLATRSEWLRHAWPRIGRMSLRGEWADLTRRWKEEGVFQEIEVEGWKGQYCILADAVPDFETLRSSEVPTAWRPRSTSTVDEAVFLCPLETVSGAGRATQLFDFDYVWEVYKPASKRRWGYYTMPILYQDGLCARIEMRCDRAEHTLRVLGFWPEEASLRRDPAFASALGRGLHRLAEFNRVAQVDVSGLRSPTMQSRVLQTARIGA